MRRPFALVFASALGAAALLLAGQALAGRGVAPRDTTPRGTFGPPVCAAVGDMAPDAVAAWMEAQTFSGRHRFVAVQEGRTLCAW